MSQQNASLPQPALLFLPDISGFTKFVQSVAIEHGRHITAELLEKIMGANELGLQVSEIEGDAIFFYRFGNPPTCQEMFAQIERMFLAFHSHLRLYSTQRLCPCNACVSAPNLTLKFFAHYGSVMPTRIMDHTKLFGSDIITAHRLMKNEIQESEYALITQVLTKDWPPEAFPDWAHAKQGSQEYDVGRVDFDYVTVAPLRQRVKDPSIEDYSIPGVRVPMFSCEQQIDAPMDLIYQVLSDLPLRLKWMQGARSVDLLNDKVNRLGTRHRCVVDKNSPVMVTSGGTRSADALTLTETDEKRMMCSVYVLERVSDTRTRLRVEAFIKDSLMLKILFALLLKRKLQGWFSASAANLKQQCEAMFRERLSDAPGPVSAEPS